MLVAVAWAYVLGCMSVEYLHRKGRKEALEQAHADGFCEGMAQGIESARALESRPAQLVRRSMFTVRVSRN